MNRKEQQSQDEQSASRGNRRQKRAAPRSLLCHQARTGRQHTASAVSGPIAIASGGPAYNALYIAACRPIYNVQDMDARECKTYSSAWRS